MKRPNKFITIALVLMTLFFVYDRISSHHNKTEAKRPLHHNAAQTETTRTEKGNQAPSEGETAPEIESASVSSYLSLEREKRSALEWGENPFLYPPELVLREKIRHAEEALILTVTAIMGDGAHRVATIDRSPYVVSVGDQVEDERVARIGPESIVLAKNGKKTEFFLEPLE